jgi:predicted metal-dependent enzyme (double-stranded beta helix superfamily)
MSAPRPRIDRLRAFVVAMTRVVERGGDEATVLAAARPLLAALLSVDDWLPPACAAADPRTYAQYLLHCDALERFSVVSFVWGPGQRTPVHDHTVWGLVGVLRGAERAEAFQRGPTGLAAGPVSLMRPGDLQAVSPTLGDVHRVSSAADEVTVSIHVYGANIGALRRHWFDDAGAAHEFISGYTADVVPNLWDRAPSRVP